MKKTFTALGVVASLLLLGAVAFFFWASAGRLPDEALAETHRYAPATAVAGAPDTLVATTYNVGYLSGMTNNKPMVRAKRLFTTNMDQAVNLLRRASPNVVGMQEVDFGAARSFYVPQLDTIATGLGVPYAAKAVNWDERYLPFPYGRPAVHFGRVVSGQAVLSHAPIRAHRRYVLPRPPLPFYRDAFYLDRLAQTVLLDWSGRPLLVINVHLEAFDRSTRKRQARAVRALFDHVARPGVPVLLLGDFNAQIGAEGDSTMALLRDGTDLRPALVPGADTSARPTFPADAPTRKIDHILYRPGLLTPAGGRVQCGSGASPPSDHCAVTVTFALAPDSAAVPPVDSVASALPPAGPWP